MALWPSNLWMIITLPGGETGGSDPLNMLMPMLMVVGVLLLGILLTLSIRGKVAKQAADTPSPRERIEQLRSRGADVGPVQAAESKMVETARQLATQLDNKAERLEHLLAEADQRLAQLRVAAAGGDGTPSSTDSTDPLTESIYELADAGHDPIQIARQLDEQVGKIELILALRSGTI